MTLLRVASIIVLAGAILACEPELAPIDYGDPTQSGVIASPIHLTLLSPDPSTPVLSPSVYLHIVSSGQDRPDRVEVSLDAGPYIEATLTEDQSYRYRAPLLPGVNVVDLRASSAEGTQHIQRFELRYEGESPGIRILTPVAYSPVGSEGVHVEGLARASEGRGVVEVLVCGGGDSWSVAEHVDGFFSLSHVVVTDPQGQLKARVIDSAGQSSQMFIELLMDEIPPTLTLSSPGSGAVVEEAFVWVEGIALDDAGVSHVEVNVGDAGWVFASGVAPFEAFVTLDPGWNEIDVRVVDLAGNQTQMQRWVYRERHVSLVAHPAYAAGETLTLSIGKAALEALLPADAADDIVLMYLDVMVLLEEALKTVKNYETYGLDTSAWDVPEWNLYRILTMTADNVDVSGTALEPMLSLASNLGVPAPLMLADLVGVGVTDSLLEVDEVADGMVRNVLAPHPAAIIDDEGQLQIAVTMADALADLVTLGDKLGPAGDHPGLLYDAAPSPVFQPGFKLTISGKSNLIPFEGINLSSGKAWLFGKSPDVPLVTFDFMDPETFQVEGVVDEPELDLFFLVNESPEFIGGGQTAGVNPDTGFFKGDSPVWELPSWSFEHLVADIGFRAFRNRYSEQGYKATFSYDVGTIEDATVVSWNQGWVDIQTIAGLGDPPAPGYFWDHVLELAQRRLHDGGLAEGDADLHIAITGVRVPLTAEEVIAQTRPVLEAQKDVLSKALLGDHSSYSSTCDLFAVKAGNGDLWLYHTAPSDVPGMVETHASPGIYSDPLLLQKASTTADQGLGDTLHEKLRIPEGGLPPLYVADVDGSVWRIAVDPPEGDHIRVGLRPADGGE